MNSTDPYLTRKEIGLFNFRQNEPQQYLSKSNTDCLKGFLAIVIILSHIRGQLPVLNDTIIGQILTASGYLAVGVFFFISGYGLQFSVGQKGKPYLLQFFFHRIFPFYCQYLFVVLIYVLFYAVSGNMQNLTFSNLVQTLTFGNTIVQNGWYFQTILLFYLAFWLISSITEKNHLKLLGITVCMIIYCGICILRDTGPYSYVSAFCFPLGVLWYCHKEKIDHFFLARKTSTVRYIGVFFLFSATLLLGNYPILPRPYMLLIRCVSSVFFTVFVFLTLMKVRISFPMLCFAGNISLELYAFHGIFLLLFQLYPSIHNPIIYAGAVLISSVIFSWLMHPVLRAVSRNIHNWGLLRTGK